MADAKKAGRVEGTSRLALQLTGLTLADGTQANIQSQWSNVTARPASAATSAAVATTTGVGAAIGAAADWGRGAAIGAGAGAAAGLIGVLLTRGTPTVVYPETLLTFRLETQVIVDLTRAPQAFRYVGPDEYERPPCRPRWRAAPGDRPRRPRATDSVSGLLILATIPVCLGYPYAFGPSCRRGGPRRRLGLARLGLAPLTIANDSCVKVKADGCG